MGAGELFGDLVAGVSAPNHEHGSLEQLTRTPVARAVRLPDLGVELAGQLGDVRRLERTRRDHNLVGSDRPLADFEEEAPIILRDPTHGALKLDGKVELFRVALEIGDHIVTCGVAVRIAGEGESRQRAVTARREESQRVPALAPSRRG